jgi:hypothetical protein
MRFSCAIPRSIGRLILHNNGVVTLSGKEGGGLEQSQPRQVRLEGRCSGRQVPSGSSQRSSPLERWEIPLIRLLGFLDSDSIASKPSAGRGRRINLARIVGSERSTQTAQSIRVSVQ